MQQSSEASTEPKEYAPIFKLGHKQQYEGEVDDTGKPSGKGIRILENDNYLYIEEGIFVDGMLTGFRRYLE